MTDQPPKLTAVEISIQGQVAIITMNRPSKFNAWNLEMFHDLEKAFDWIDRSVGIIDIRVTILCGSGKHFTAGLDLGAFANGLMPEGTDPARQGLKLQPMLLDM